MRVKQTKRIFKLSIPDGTEKTMIRTFVRATDGTDHPVDKEIEVAKYKPKTVAYVCGHHLDRKPEDVHERLVLANENPGTLCVSTEDVVEYVEIPDLKSPEPEVIEA